ncbi:MAG: TolC family protein [Acidobacteriia bacterium]|nr:TolC family protein [Terriglobia bacterium]
MQKLMEVLDFRKISDLWTSLIQQYQVLGIEGVVITLLILAGNGLLQRRKWSWKSRGLSEPFPVLLRASQAVMLGVVLVLANFPAYSQSPTPSQGAASAQPAAQSPQVLTLRQAVETALQNNTQVQLSAEEIQAAKGRSNQARAALLPNLDGQVSQSNITLNLKAQGIDFSRIPVPGFSTIGALVGPFDRFDARAFLQQNLINFAAIRQYQAARAGYKVSTLEAEAARRDTIATVAVLYYRVLQAAAHIEATQANIRLNESLLELAVHQKDAGTGTAVDVTRAQVQLAQQRQRLLSDQVEYEDSRLRLLKTMGKDVSIEVQLADTLTVRDEPILSIPEALTISNENRIELQSQAEREHAARLQLSSVKAERYPSVGFFADYGSSGLTPSDSALPTRTYGVAATLPIFDGGRREGRIAEQSARTREEAIRLTDVKQQVELEVRRALKTLESARQQVVVAEENLKLSLTELELARDRFQEGVTSNIEVVNAQTSLAQARDGRIEALYLFNLARVGLVRAVGQVEKIYQ